MGEATLVPRPREHDLPNGNLAVSSHWVHGVKDTTTVPAGSRPLYRLLMGILEGVHVPDCMPARLAAECEDLVDVKRAVLNIDRGRSDIGNCGYGMGYCHTVRDAIEEHRDRQPLRLVAVGCSGSKHHDDGLLPSEDRYKGGYWTNKREYYEAFADDARIISAEHALLDPDEPIEYYEAVPGDLEGIPVDSDQRLPTGNGVETLLDQWVLEVFEGLQGWLWESLDAIDPRDVVLEILLGEKRYASRLRERGVFDGLSIPSALEIRFPFRDEPDAQGGIGNQRGWMCSQVDATIATDGGDRDE